MTKRRIQRSECGAVVALLRGVLINTLEHVDVPDDVRERFDSFLGYLNGARVRSTRQQEEWVSSLMISGILPGFKATTDDVELEAMAKLVKLTERRRRRFAMRPSCINHAG